MRRKNKVDPTGIETAFSFLFKFIYMQHPTTQTISEAAFLKLLTTHKLPEPPLHGISTLLKHSKLLYILLSPVQILQDDKKQYKPPQNLVTLLVMEKHPHSAPRSSSRWRLMPQQSTSMFPTWLQVTVQDLCNLPESDHLIYAWSGFRNISTSYQHSGQLAVGNNFWVSKRTSVHSLTYYA